METARTAWELASWLVLGLAGCADAPSGGLAALDTTTVPDVVGDASGDAGDGVATTDDAVGGDVEDGATSPADATPAAVADADADATGDSAEVDVPVVDPPLDPYEQGFVHEVTLTVEASAWAALCQETRSIFSILGPGCLSGPAKDSFTWYHADVTFDGRTLADVGLRKKGFLGSLDAVRPALRIETDHWVRDQRLGGVEHFTLNNGKQDASRLRQCLAYGVFAAAGVPAPRCAFAHVTVNGADLGLYVIVEPVKKGFVRDHFTATRGDDDPTSRQLWEGSLSDFRPEFIVTFDPKFDSAPTDPAPLAAVIDALAAPDEELLAALDEVIDLDAFFAFWAAEVLVAHWDGYAGNTNNFYVYQRADGRLAFVPWGVDGTFLDLATQNGGAGRPVSVLASGALANRLYAHPEGRTRYHEALRHALEVAWDEAALADTIGAWDALVAPYREAGSAAEGEAGVAQLEAFVAARRGAIEAELATPPEWPDPLRGEVCLRDAGTVTGTLATTWGTLPIDNLFSTGTGTLAVESSVLPPLTFQEIGAKAGIDEAALPGSAQLVLAAHVVGAGYVAVLFQAALPFAAGARPVDHVDTFAYAYYLDGTGQAQLIGLLAGGDLVIEKGSEVDGAPVNASFELTLYMF